VSSVLALVPEEPAAQGPSSLEVLDHGFVALDGALASDLAVVNGARVSFNQESDEMTDRDAGLIRFLMREKHGSPFEHGYFRFLVKAPLFVVREHHRHRAGHSYNEWSGRYSPGAYSFEAVDREKAECTRREIKENASRAFEAYERLLEQGIAKEVARSVLPLSTYTKYYWSCNPRSLMHFCSLRNHESAQYEIRKFAEAAEAFLERLMPITHAAFVAADRVAP
jgi:thymidylate synthase (FAD)